MTSTSVWGWSEVWLEEGEEGSKEDREAHYGQPGRYFHQSDILIPNHTKAVVTLLRTNIINIIN